MYLIFLKMIWKTLTVLSVQFKLKKKKNPPTPHWLVIDISSFIIISLHTSHLSRKARESLAYSGFPMPANYIQNPWNRARERESQFPPGIKMHFWWTSGQPRHIIVTPGIIARLKCVFCDGFCGDPRFYFHHTLQHHFYFRHTNTIESTNPC